AAIGGNRQRTALVLFVLAGLFLIIPIYMGVQFKGEYLNVCLWGTILVLICAGAGAWQLLREPRKDLSDADAGRFLVLALGGMAGLTTTLLGFSLAIQWWADVFAGGLEAWRSHAGSIMIVLLAFFGGLLVMFVSLQL